ncbi:MAG TPA: acyl-CoA desaturase [Gammaproteobacteria bacterium]|nr:acyl-CoA desaturase [Gammaproteobacteria bacterium]
MTDFTRPGTRPEKHLDGRDDAASRRRLSYSGSKAFQRELRRRVDGYFSETGAPRRDVAAWYLKAGMILAAFVSSYTLLVFFASAWWQAVPLTAVLAFSVVGIGFNIMHDAGHGAVSRHRFVNRLMAHSLDIVGGSSYLWHWKHDVLHHNYANITGHDTDVAIGMLGRFTPHQPRYPHQRWQHWYVWVLYGLMAIKWQLFDDFRTLLRGKIGPHRIPRPRGADLAMLVACKLAFFVLAFVIPLRLHPIATFLPYYLLFAVVAGLVLSTVFQLAHTVEEAEFPSVPDGARSVDNAWAVHQVQTAVNFCHGNRLVTWLLGGLNYQIEHHLFPDVSHCNYPGLSGVVKATCGEFGIAYKEHPSFWAGIRSHFRWLRRMGEPVAA